jgi:hypothetical protein
MMVLAPAVLAPAVLAPAVLAPAVLAPAVLAPAVLAPAVLAKGPMSIAETTAIEGRKSAREAVTRTKEAVGPPEGDPPKIRALRGLAETTATPPLVAHETTPGRTRPEPHATGDERREVRTGAVNVTATARIIGPTSSTTTAPTAGATKKRRRVAERVEAVARRTTRTSATTTGSAEGMRG